MRALPGRASRTLLGETATVTRGSTKVDQRERILAATGELVAKRGYKAVTVELIVKRARVSFKTFYSHFPNKEACFLELFDSATARARKQVETALAADPDAVWPQQVITAVRVLSESVLGNRLIARAVIVEAPTVGPVISERYQRTMNILAPLLRGGREFAPQSGALPETLEETLAGGVLWSAYQRVIAGEVERIEAMLPEAIEFLLRPYLGEAEAGRWARLSAEQLQSSEDSPAST